MRATRRTCKALLAAVVGWCSVGCAVAAAPYFITVTGQPASIACTDTGFSFQSGATLSWQVQSTASIVDVNVLINGTAAGSQPQPIGALGLAGTQPLSGGNTTPYASIAFPYSVKFEAVPRDAYTDGVSVSFTCTASGGTSFATATIPARVPAFQATPSSVSFPATAVDAISAATTVTVTNNGTADASAMSITSSNWVDFAIGSNTCTSPLARNASCSFAATFRPSAPGARSALLQVADAEGASTSVQLKGTGTGGAQLSVQASVAFGSQTVGTASTPTNVIVTNVGTTAATVSAVTSSNATEFPVSSTCANVAAGAACTISIAFAPAAAGARAATVTIASNGAGSPQAIAVSGTGTPAAAGGQLSVPATAAFGTQAVGTPSSPVTVNIGNTGGAPVTVAGVASSAPAEFAVTTTCATVAAGGSCTLTLTFTPATAGARSATITVTSNGIGSPQSMAATGTGSATPAPGQLVVSGSAAFGSVVVGAASAPATLALTNTGGATVVVAGIGSSNPAEFAIAGSTCGSVAGGASCEFSVTFSPAAAGERSATITIASNGAGSPQLVGATGTGVTTPPPPPATADVIEYHHAQWDHYFMTSIQDEITKLDNGVFAGWARTGYKFKAYALDTAGSANVCRFFSTSFAPRSSHFYTPFASECTDVKANPDWSFEGEVFGVPVPNLAGACPAGTVPVYRLYNDGQGAAPNHRYTTDLAVRTQMIAQGWVPEGYGDLGVIMCAPV